MARTSEVLVVDDDAEGREALALVLEAHGHTVRRAANGRVALAMIAERLPGVVLLDLEMPVMNGWEVLASMERAGTLRVCQVVAISATASPPDGVAFLRKPCEIEALFRLIASQNEEPGLEEARLDG